MIDFVGLEEERRTEIRDHCSVYYYLSKILNHLETPIVLIPEITFWRSYCYYLYILDEEPVSEI